MNRLIVWLVAAGLLVTGCSSSSSPTKASSTKAAPVSVRGQVVVGGQYVETDDGAGTTCYTLGNSPLNGTLGSQTSPYDDVKPGAQVVVTNAAGTTLAIGTIGAGTAGPDLVNDGSDHHEYECRFRFTVSGVPGGQKFYGVKVAAQASKQFTAAQLPSASIMLGAD